jgi:cytochrome P450 family 6
LYKHLNTMYSTMFNMCIIKTFKLTLKLGAEELEVERKALKRDDPKSGAKQLTENEIVAQAFMFFLAGYETSATTLSFCTYELVRSPGIQQRLHDEVVAAFDANGEMEYDVLARLPYLDAVVSETLRMHSPAQRMPRICSVDYTLGDTGVKVTAGQNIDIPIYAIHHCEEFYPEPFKFDPDRFMPENRHKVLPYTYLPFGAGPRNCIGMRFSLLEIKLGLAHMIKNYRFSICPETDVPVQYKRMLRIGAPKRMNVRVEKRV